MKEIYRLSELKKCFFNNVFVENNNINIEKVVFDSRDACENCLFFALNGDNNDGHNFIHNAIENGAVCIVGEYIPDNVKDKITNKQVNFIMVKDSMKAFQQLAVFHRKRLKAKVIGITGNIGKTTTREMINIALSSFYKTFTNSLNYNGQIGVPYTICNTPLDTEILILEMGMSKAGELDIISKIAKPDISIITKIAPAHVGNFNNIEEVVYAKAEIFNGMSLNGFIILDKNSEYFYELKLIAEKKKIGNIITIDTNENDNDNTDKADICCSNIEFNKNFTISYNVHFSDGESYKSNIDGLIKHNVYNSLFVFAIAKILNLDIHKVIENLYRFKIVNGRGNIEDIVVNGKNISIINDCYNSSPEALKSSIQYLNKIQNIFHDRRAIAVIGDMLELGEQSSNYHMQISKCLIENNIKNVILIGEYSRVIFDALPESVEKLYFKNTDDFKKEIVNYITNKDILLFKASHGMHFEKLIQELKNSN